MDDAQKNLSLGRYADDKNADLTLQEDGEKLYNPWNPANKIIDDDTIHTILNRYGYTIPITDTTLFKRACVHKSYTLFRPENQNAEKVVYEVAPKPDDCIPLQEFHNEELEFVGDSILGTVVALYIFTRYRGMGEGFLTKLKIKIVNNKTLGEIAKAMGMPQWLILSRHVEDYCHGRTNLRICGSILEAWIGAMYFYAGADAQAYDICSRWLTTVMDTHIDFAELIREDKNYKDQLLRFYHTNWHVCPRYRLIEEVGPVNDRYYTMGVVDTKDKVVAQYTARNKKEAEQQASRLALLYYGAL
jgi:ribonuclease-3